MSTVSLRTRLLLFSVALVVAAVLVIGGVAYVEHRGAVLGGLDEALRAKAEGILAALDDSEDRDDLKREADTIVSVRQGKRPPMYCLWLEGAARPLAASDPPDSRRGRWLAAFRAGAPPAPNEPRYAEMGQYRYEYRALWLRRPLADGTPANVVVAESIHYALHEVEEFRNVLLTVAAVAGAAMLLFALLAVRRALRPIGLLSERIDRVTHRDMPTDALRRTPVPPELRPFVQSTADMIDRLRRAIAAQQQFVADASHELRTPLAVARSTLQAALLTDPSAEQLHQAVSHAVEDLDRVQRVTEQLLLLARLDRPDGGDENLEMVAFRPLLTDLAERFTPLAERTGGRIDPRAAADVEALGRRADIERMLGNLIENAILHGPPGGTVTLHAAPDGDGYVRLCVHDEGGAIAPADLPRLFERFYRADRSRSRRTGGTGLGLAIAREIARRHGGDIRIESSPQAGTSAIVRLPRRGPRASRPC